MESQTEMNPVPKVTKKKLIVTVALFLSVVLAIPIGLFVWLQKDIQIQADGQVLKVKTFTKTVEEVLAEAKISYREEDKITPELTTETKANMVIKVERAFPVKVVADGKKIDLYTVADVKVEEILKRAKISLAAKDKVSPELAAVVNPGQQIRVVRVTEETEIKDIAIAYKTKKKADSSMLEGKRKVIQKGEKGLNQKVIKVTFEDGEEVNREVVEERLVKEPVNEVISYGTKPKVQTVSRGGQNLTYSKAITGLASAYTHTGNQTKSGTWPQVGRTIAVDPSVIPLGSRVFIETSYPGVSGFYIAEDTGGKINRSSGRIVDIFMGSESKANRWGVRNIKVYILK